MSEQEVREGLRAAVADEPALSLDPEALVDKAKRETRRRWAILGIGLATLVVAGTAVALPIVLAPPGGDPGSTGEAESGAVAAYSCARIEVRATAARPQRASAVPVNPSATVAGKPSGYLVPADPSRILVPLNPSLRPLPSAPLMPKPVPSGPVPTPYPCPSSMSAAPPPLPAWPPPNVTARQYQPEQLQQRGAEMRTHLETWLAQQIPAAMQITVTGFTGGGPDFLEGSASFTVNGVRSTIGIRVSAPGAAGVPAPSQECPDAAGCQADSLGGARVVKMEKSGDGAVAVTVVSYRPTGAVVRATGFYTGPGQDPAHNLSTTVGLLTGLTTDPALSL